MSAVSLPRQLVAPKVVKGDDRLKSTSVELLPANAGATYSPESNRRLVWNIPAYAKSFIDCTRSYLSFNIKKTGSAGDSIIASNVPFIDRMTLKAGTVLLEDLRDYALQEKLHALTESSDYGEGRQWMTGDYQDVLRKYTSGTNTLGNTIMSKIQSEQADGRTYTKPLISGVLGAGQQYYLPVGMLAASGSQALQLELFLADAHQVITRNTSVTDNISYEDEKVEITFYGTRFTPPGTEVSYALIVDHKTDRPNTLLLEMGFDKSSQTLDPQRYTQDYMTGNLHRPATGLVLPSQYFDSQLWYNYADGTPADHGKPNLEAHNRYTSENTKGFYLCSQALTAGGNVLKAQVTGNGRAVVQHDDHLAFIPNKALRDQYNQYETNVIEWVDVYGDLHTFDLEVRNHLDKPLVSTNNSATSASPPFICKP